MHDDTRLIFLACSGIGVSLNYVANGSHFRNSIWLPPELFKIDFITFLDPTNMGVDTNFIFLACLVIKISLKVSREWWPF